MIVVLLFGCFILGVLQGSIRRLLGIGSMVFSFLIAAVLRDEGGKFLAGNWTQFNPQYNQLLAFVLIFILSAVIMTIAIEVFYHRVELNARHPIVDDIIGGSLGVLEGLVVLMIAVVILSSYQLPDAKWGDVSLLRQAQDAVVHESHIAGFIRDWFAPIFVHLLSPLLPSDLVRLWP